MATEHTEYLTPESIFKDERFALESNTACLNVIIEVTTDEEVVGYLIGVLPPKKDIREYRHVKGGLISLCTNLGEVRRGFSLTRREARFRLISKVVNPWKPAYVWHSAKHMIMDLNLRSGYRKGGREWNELWDVVVSLRDQVPITTPKMSRIIFPGNKVLSNTTLLPRII